MATPDVARSAEQIARERALVKIFDALEEIEVTTKRIRRYRDEVAQLRGCDDLATALGTACDRLEAARKALQQDAYFNHGQGRLF